MSDGVLIEYPTLAIYAAQFGEGALKDEARAVLAELEAERALCDSLADALLGFMPIANVPPEVERALARYREARQR